MKQIRLLFIGLLLFLGPNRGLFPEIQEDKFNPTPYLGTHWYGVYLLGNKVGYGSFRLAPSNYRGHISYTTEFFVSYRLNLGGNNQEMTLREEKTFLPEKGLVAFTSTNDSILGKNSFTGELRNNRFEVTTTTGKRTIPAVGEKLTDALADLILVHSHADSGTTVESVQIETSLLKPIRVIHTVDSIEKKILSGVSTDIYHIKSEFPELGISTQSLIDENLHVLEANISLLTIREEGEEAAKNIGYSTDLLLAVSIHPDRPVPEPRNIRSLTIILRGVTDPGLILSDDLQKASRIDSSTYRINITTCKDSTIPARQIPVLEAGLKEYLKPTAYIQSNHPSIRSLAQQIVGSEKDVRRVSEKLVQWLYQNLEKSFLAAIPNAVDVLKTRSGDCKAHAVLFTALARSLGLPTRIVSGLVETNDGGFYYHQWAEVYSGQWIPVDPVFGMVPADATHIKLSQGDMSEQLRLLNALGTISIEIRDYELAEKSYNK